MCVRQCVAESNITAVRIPASPSAQTILLPKWNCCISEIKVSFLIFHPRTTFIIDCPLRRSPSRSHAPFLRAPTTRERQKPLGLSPCGVSHSPITCFVLLESVACTRMHDKGTLGLYLELMHSRFVAHIGSQVNLPGENCCVFSRTESPRKNTTIFIYEHRR